MPRRSSPGAYALEADPPTKALMPLPDLLLSGSLALVLAGGGEAARQVETMAPDSTVAAADSAAAAAPDSVAPLPLLSGPLEERIRLGHLLEEAPRPGFLIRAPSMLQAGSPSPAERPHGFRWGPLPPELHVVWNSDLPFSLNQGAVWAGRGLSSRLTVGARLEVRNAILVLAPHLVHEENREFQTFSYPEVSAPRRRHPLASPFHYPPGSLDLFQRPGREPRTHLDLGQTSLTVRTGSVAFGAASENLWWGPGIRNALLMSAQAPGIPHLFLRTGEPLETGIGSVEGRWIVGRLEESQVFDFDPDNDHRSLSALALVFSPAFDRGLAVGAARAVYGPSGSLPVGAAFDVFRGVGRPSAAPGDTLVEPGPDQLFSLFARWVFPDAGFEAYGEWGRHEQPRNLRDALELPHHSRGYTVGFQFARPAPRSTTLRLQAEITNLEPSTSYRVRPFGEWYASRSVPQGYTHRGRALGAAIGPSGSSQWLAGDLFGPSWRLGAFGGRIRWENQAQFTYPPEFRRADVSLFAGLRGDAGVGPFLLSAEYTAALRLNYLFQAEPVTPVVDRGVDLRNHTLQITLTSGGPLP